MLNGRLIADERAGRFDPIYPTPMLCAWYFDSGLRVTPWAVPDTPYTRHPTPNKDHSMREPITCFRKPNELFELAHAVLCEVIGEPIKRSRYLIGEPIKLTGKQALRKALSA